MTFALAPSTPDTRGLVLIGSYTHSLPHVEARGEGVTLLSHDPETGSLSRLATFSDIRNPTYLVHSARHGMVYCVEEMGDEAQSAVVALKLTADAEGFRIVLAARLPAHGAAPCHVSLDHAEQVLFVSNYGGGNLVAYRLDAAGVPMADDLRIIQRNGHGPVADRQEASHLHQALVTPDGGHLLTCDLGADEIARFSLADGLPAAEPETILPIDPGALPRHMAFSLDGRHLHVLLERGNAVVSLDLEIQRPGSPLLASTLPADFEGTSYGGAIRLHPSGRFLYASNRGHNSIAAFRAGPDGSLSPIGVYPSRGAWPRDFAIDPAGRHLVVANQDSHALMVNAVNAETGALTPAEISLAIGSPVCIVFL